MTATQTNDNPDEPHSLTPRLRAEAADLDRDCTLGRRPAEQDCLQRRAAHFRRLSAALLDHVPAHPGSALVDLGCGPTGPLDLMAGRAGPSGCVVGIELDPVHVESARNFARERGLPTWRSSTGTPGAQACPPPRACLRPGAARPGVVRSAAAPAAPHFDTRHAICHYPGQKRLNVRPAPGRRPLTDMPLFPYR